MPVTANDRSTGRGNPRNNTSATWPASTAVDAGSFVYQDSSGNDQPASAFTFLADLASTQRAFKQVFRGISETKRVTTQTTAGSDILDGGIKVAGEFTMTCAALGAAVRPGAYVGPDSNAGVTALVNSQVVVCTPDCAIGKVTKAAASGATELTFELLDTVTTGAGMGSFGLGIAGVFASPAPIALTTSATLTAAQLLNGMLTANQGAAGAASYTLPTGTLMDTAMTAALPGGMPVNGCFLFTLTNISTNAAEIATVAAGTNFTVVGNMTVAANGATTSQATGVFLVRKTATNTYTCTRIAS